MEAESPVRIVEEHPSLLRVEEIGDGILVIVFDTGMDGPPFVLSPESLDVLAETVERVGGQAGVRGLFFRSAHPMVFCAGADIEAMAKIRTASEAEALLLKGQRLFERIAHLPHPTVALIHGTCVGGGFELALACDARAATPDRATRIGLPEIKLGIIPAWGGSTRMVRLIGLSDAVPLVTSGRVLNAHQAHRQGLVDSLVHREQLVAEGLALAARLRRGDGIRQRRSSIARWFLNRTPPGRAMLDKLAIRSIRRETKGHYPAPEAALRVMVQGAGLRVEDSLALERREVMALLQTDVHKNLLRLFRITRESKRPPIYQLGRHEPALREVSVIGAGVMGAGIAALMAREGLSVRVIDPAPEALVRARRLANDEIERRVRRRELARSEGSLRLGRMTFATTIDGLAGVDLVIEAVPEKRELKEETLGRMSAEMRGSALAATNTSSFPVSELARAVSGRDRFVGLHFFNPPLKMPLLEIVRGKETSDAALARGLKLAELLGKTPIVVRDSPGFLVNRLLAPYFMEACRLAQEGVGIDTIDGALVDFGMPMGPFRLMDEVGLDVILDASKHMAERPELGLSVHPLIEGLAGQQAFGKKSGAGFYSYDAKGKRQGMNPKFDHMVRDFQRSGGDSGQTSAAIRDRLIGRMVAEAHKVLGEGIVLCKEDIDIGTVFGIGYPAFRGGLLHDAETRAAGRHSSGEPL